MTIIPAGINIHNICILIPLAYIKFIRYNLSVEVAVERICCVNNKISLRIVCQVAMLIAIAFVLERLVPIVNSPTMRITLAFIPMMACGMFFGPIWAMVAYGITDILGWPIMGLTPIPLVLVSRIVNGFLFGLILYNRHRKELKTYLFGVLNAFAVQIVCGMGLTTLGLSIFYGIDYSLMLWSRLPQHLIYIALMIVTFPLLLELQEALRKSKLIE